MGPLTNTRGVWYGFDGAFRMSLIRGPVKDCPLTEPDGGSRN
jgi:hypothetical protein